MVLCQLPLLNHWFTALHAPLKFQLDECNSFKVIVNCGVVPTVSVQLSTDSS